MTWRTAALLILAGVFAACSSEGGSRGSGISTLIRGNVASVQTAARMGTLTQRAPGAGASTSLEGIQVTVAGTDVHGETDANGNFSVQGSFDGTFDLLLQRAADALMARLTVTIPAGGTLTLDNISVARDVATAERQQADFDAILTAVDCGGPTIILKSVQQDSANPDRYQMNLGSSTLQDAHGNAAACGDLHVGQEVMVHQAEVVNGIFGGGVVQLVD